MTHRVRLRVRLRSSSAEIFATAVTMKPTLREGRGRGGEGEGGELESIARDVSEQLAITASNEKFLFIGERVG
jgi:hypothetical protein